MLFHHFLLLLNYDLGQEKYIPSYNCTDSLFEHALSQDCDLSCSRFMHVTKIVAMSNVIQGLRQIPHLHVTYM